MKFLLFLLINISLFSQTTFKIFDKTTLTELQGVRITNMNNDKSFISDISGEVTLDLELDDIITFQIDGYKDVTYRFVNRISVLEIYMTSNPIYSNEVLVTSTRFNSESKNNITELKNSEITKRNQGRDITYILKSTPSVVVQSDAGNGIGYSGIRIRGTDPTRINVTINGIPLNDSESQGVWWVNMPDLLSSIEDMQVQRGVGTSTNGSGSFGGSINILTTGIKNEMALNYSSSFGSYNTKKNTLKFNTGLLNNHWNVDARISKISSDGYIDRASSDLSSIFLSSSYINDSHLIKFNTIIGKEKTYQSWYGIPEEILKTNRTYNYYTYDNQTDNYWQNHYQLFYSNSLDNNTTFHVGLNYTHGEGYYEEFKGNESPSDYGLTTWYFNNDDNEADIIRRKWLNNNYYVLSSSYNHQNSDYEFIFGGLLSYYEGDHYGRIIKSLRNDAVLSNNKFEYYFNDAHKYEFNVYTKFKFNLNSKMTAFTDFQLRQINYQFEYDVSPIRNSDSPLFFNPKIGINYNISASQSLVASYSIAQKEANRNDYVDSEIGTLPKSEFLRDLEIGYTQEHKNYLININYYYMDYIDQLVLTGRINDVGAYNRENVDKSYRTGIESTISYKWDNLEISNSTTISKNKIVDYNFYYDRYDQNWNYLGQGLSKLKKTNLAFSPELISNLGLKYSMGKLEFNIDTKYVGKQYLDNSSNSNNIIPAYMVSDAQINYTMDFGDSYLKSVNVYFQINNMLSEEYEANGWVYNYELAGDRVADRAYYPQAERNFIFGVALELK